MFLPTPNAITLPEGITPTGIGLEACNSGNSCGKLSCDAYSSSVGKCGWTLVFTSPLTAAF